MKIVTKQEKIEVGVGEYEELRTVAAQELAAPEGAAVEVSSVRGERLTLWVGNEFAEFTLAEWDEFVRSVSALTP